MAKTSGRVSADRAEDIIERLSMKNIRPLWWTKYGPDMDILLSREDVLDKLGVNTNKLNALERRGVDSILGLSLHNLKKFAQKKKYNWVEIAITADNNRRYVYYGFTTNIDQINQNIVRFQDFHRRWKDIANETKKLGETQKKQIAQ